MFAPTVVTVWKSGSVHETSAQRWISKPVSFDELSIHARSTRVPDMVVAARPLGAAGPASTTVAVPEKAELPVLPALRTLRARMRYV